MQSCSTHGGESNQNIFKDVTDSKYYAVDAAQEPFLNQNLMSNQTGLRFMKRQ